MEPSGPTAVSDGVVRKLVIVALLAAGAIVVDQLVPGSVHFGPSGLMGLGFAALLALGLGQAAVRLRLPAISGYLATGVLLGPWTHSLIPERWSAPPLSWEVLDASVVELLDPLAALSVGIIALTVGGLFRLDMVRKLTRDLVGAVGGAVLGVFVSVLLWVASVGLGLPHLSLPGLGTLSVGTAVALAALVAVLSLAGSPAAIISVVHGTGAKGVLSRVVLASVVVKELLVVLLFVVAAIFLPIHADGTAALAESLLVRLGGSLALGVVVGLLLSLYVKRVRREVPLFVIGVVLLVTFASERLGLPAPAVLIPAGIVAANASDEGAKLVGDVVKLSTPMYLLFFVLFGATLRVDLLLALAPFALVMVVLRMIALRLGIAAGGRIAGAHPTTVRYAWTGFVPQAGVAVPLAVVMEQSLGAPGQALSSLVLAGVVCNEAVGPILFRLGLGHAGEVPVGVTRGQAATEQEAQDAAVVAATVPPPREGTKKPARAEPWPRSQAVPDPWGPAPQLASQELNDLLLELEADLQGLGRDVVSGRFESFRKEALAYLRQVRMELLRHHRRVSNAWVGASPSELSTSLLRGEHADLAERWGAVALARGARFELDGWSPTEIAVAVDRVAEEQPEFVEAPYEAVSYDHPAKESALQSVMRVGLRARRRWAVFTDGAAPTRSVAFGTLVRYHLMGTLPPRLEGVAALVIDAERQLLDRTRELFDGVAHGYDAIAHRFPQGGDDPELRAQLAALRRSFEEDIASAVKEVGQIVEDADVRTACVLGEAMVRIKQEMERVGTFDMPTLSRRFSRVHGERDRAMARLGAGYEQARKVAAAQYASLALEFEMGSLEGRINEAVDAFASDLGRGVDGRAHRQLQRITATLDEVLPSYEEHFAKELTGAELATALRAEAKPLERVVSEAVRASLQLRDQLTNEQAVAPLLDGIARSARSLTDRYRIPSGRPPRGDWRLPPPVPVVEVPFRQIVQGYIESSVSPALLHVMRRLAAAAQPLVSSLEELDRRVSFNVEVAVAEVEEFQNDPVPAETRALVREMVLGALQRSRARFAEFEQSSASWGQEAREGVRQAVVGGLDDLRWRLVEGRIAELKTGWRRQAASGLRVLESARRLPQAASALRRELGLVMRATVGSDRIERMRATLGLPHAYDHGEFDPTAFARPGTRLDQLPLVYRRLFSAQALEAGDLLVGRTDSIHSARKVLAADPGTRLRSVALIGPDGVGKGAVANAIVRGIDGARVESLSLDGPATVPQIDTWFAAPRDNRLVIVSGLHWLVSARTGGIEPLRRFVAGVVEDRGRNAWLVRADSLVWKYMDSLAPMRDAFPEVVDLQPFDVEQLRSAVLARHGMSGYDLDFGASSSSNGQVSRVVSRRLLAARSQFSWFRALHEASGGLIRDALVLWMASVDKVDDGVSKVWMGSVPASPVDAIRHLPDDVLLTLWQIARNGWIDPEVHANLFRSSPRASEAHLNRLAHWGVLEAKEGRFRITVHLRGAVVRVMTQKGWAT